MPSRVKNATISQGSEAEAKEAGKVIKMAKRMCIKEMYEEGKSKNEISRRLGLNYRTVSKYAEMDDWNDDKLPSTAPENYPILGRFIPLIDEWLEADKTTRESSGTPRNGSMTVCVRKRTIQAATAA